MPKASPGVAHSAERDAKADGPVVAESRAVDAKAMAPKSADSMEAMAGIDRPRQTAKAPKQPAQTGVLTAGSFDDNLNPRYYSSFVNRLAQSQQSSDLTGKLAGRRLTIVVKGGDGAPVGDARVRIAARGERGVELTTRTDGRAYFVSSNDNFPTDVELSATVTPPDGTAAIHATIPKSADRWEIVAPSVQARLPRNLDLAIVLDTTGSMGDELEFLKAELKGIATTLRAKFPQVNQRIALVLYKDDGDEYVTRSFDFTTSVDELRNKLNGERAGGGGDYPEAVHAAFEAAVQLRWKSGDAARVLFHIADAPPHSQFMGRTLTAADALRKLGVAMYPIACSGYDDDAELVMRSCAMLTGGQFLFLTNDSGVGEAHGEPHIPFYHVERLEKLMVRMVASELSGKRIEPDPKEILRTVGKPIN